MDFPILHSPNSSRSSTRRSVTYSTDLRVQRRKEGGRGDKGQTAGSVSVPYLTYSLLAFTSRPPGQCGICIHVAFVRCPEGLKPRSRPVTTMVIAGTCLQKVLVNAVMSSAELCHLCWCSQACINPIFHDTCGLGDICRYVASFFIFDPARTCRSGKEGRRYYCCMHGKRYGNTADTNRNLGPG